MGILTKLRSESLTKSTFLGGFTKTQDSFTTKIKRLSLVFEEVNDDFLEALLVILLEADIGFATSNKIIEKVKVEAYRYRYRKFSQILDCLVEEMRNVYFEKDSIPFRENKEGPNIILIVGINGGGKTTSIVKLANIYKRQGKKVMLVAADTFRAGAINQLKSWAHLIDVECIAGKSGADPASVIVDACRMAKIQDIDYLLCDTAGRLQNKANLMNELAKIKRIAQRELGDDVVNVYLVIDATTGQNGLNQAQVFLDASDVNGIILTKMDGTSKGGIVLAIKDQFNIPVLYIGDGENLENLHIFEIDQFLVAISEGLKYE